MSGRNRCRETPDTFSTIRTCFGGTFSHCETACSVTPQGCAIAFRLPALSIASAKGVCRTFLDMRWIVSKRLNNVKGSLNDTCYCTA